MTPTKQQYDTCFCVCVDTNDLYPQVSTDNCKYSIQYFYFTWISHTIT